MVGLRKLHVQQRLHRAKIRQMRLVAKIFAEDNFCPVRYTKRGPNGFKETTNS